LRAPEKTRPAKLKPNPQLPAFNHFFAHLVLLSGKILEERVQQLRSAKIYLKEFQLYETQK
jgi:hypothetical protein